MSVVSGSFRARVRSSIEAPVARFFGRLGFSPNGLTVIGFGIGLVAAYFAAVQSWLIAGLIVAFGAIFDLFDGALARATSRTSRFGAFLDSTLDRASEAAVYIAIAYAFIVTDELIGAALAMAAMTSAFMVSYTRAKAESLGFSAGNGMQNVGLAPREVRTLILVIGLLGAPIAESGTGFGDGSPLFPIIALGLITLLASITAIQRILFVYKQSTSEPNIEKENV